ncbi:MAG: hypothetical protein HRT54_06715 [Colwellia sp.]|nr:hypothetical protein [Colwellia sp.]
MDSKIIKFLTKCLLAKSDEFGEKLEEKFLGQSIDLTLLSKDIVAKGNLIPCVDIEQIQRLKVRASSLYDMFIEFASEAVENQLCPFVAQSSTDNGFQVILYTVKRDRVPLFDELLLTSISKLYENRSSAGLIDDVYYSHHLYSIIWALEGWVELDPRLLSIDTPLLKGNKLQVHSLHKKLYPDIKDFQSAAEYEVIICH